MMVTSNNGAPNELAIRIADIERQLLRIRADLRPQTDSLPKEEFSALRVQVGTAWYAIATAGVREVIPLVATQQVPEAPFWAIGTFRYRGHTLMAVDLYRRLYGEPKALHPSMVIIVTKPPHEVGLIAEAVGNLFVVDPSQIQPPSTGIAQSPYLSGTIPDSGGRVMHLLSLSRISRESVLEVEGTVETSSPRHTQSEQGANAPASL